MVTDRFRDTGYEREKEKDDSKVWGCTACRAGHHFLCWGGPQEQLAGGSRGFQRRKNGKGFSGRRNSIEKA